jgi:hypothetical protein
VPKDLVAALLWFLSAALAIDGWTYRLAARDPATGRERGCYTRVERWLGRTSPSDAIRYGEQGGAILGCAVAAYLVVRARRRMVS